MTPGRSSSARRAGWSLEPLGALWSSPFGSSARPGVSRPLPAKGPRQLLAGVLAVGGIGGERPQVAERVRHQQATVGRRLGTELRAAVAGCSSATWACGQSRPWKSRAPLGRMPGLWLRRVSAPAMPRRDTSCCRKPHRVACASSTSPALWRTSRGGARLGLCPVRRSGGPRRCARVAPTRRGLLRGSLHPCMAQDAHAPAPPGRVAGGSMRD